MTSQNSQISKSAFYQIDKNNYQNDNYQNDKNNYQNDNSKSLKEIMFSFPLEIERMIYEYAKDTDKFNNCINELNSEIKYCDDNDADAFHVGFHDYLLDKLNNRLDDESDDESYYESDDNSDDEYIYGLDE